MYARVSTIQIDPAKLAYVCRYRSRMLRIFHRHLALLFLSIGSSVCHAQFNDLTVDLTPKEFIGTVDSNSLYLPFDLTADADKSNTNASERTPGALNTRHPLVILIHACAGITPLSKGDLARWTTLLAEQGYAVFVIDQLSARNVRPGENCIGMRRPVGQDRLIKDIFDVTEKLSRLPNINPNRIFTLGFSLGAMTGASVAGETKGRRYADKPHPRAIAGLYGGCRYGNGREVWLNGQEDLPILWLMGDKDEEAPARDCVAPVKYLQSRTQESEWHIYENATHCWDCRGLDGFRKVAGNGNSVEYHYDENATKDSEQRVLKFFAKFK